MPYKVVKDLESETETIGKTRIALAKELKKVKPGEAAIGFIGDGPKQDTKQPKPRYTADEINEAQGLRNLLKKYIVPPALGSKFTDRQVSIRFSRKVDAQTLEQLRRFWDKPIPEDGNLTIEEQAEVQRLWDDISP